MVRLSLGPRLAPLLESGELQVSALPELVKLIQLIPLHQYPKWPAWEPPHLPHRALNGHGMLRLRLVYSQPRALTLLKPNVKA